AVRLQHATLLLIFIERHTRRVPLVGVLGDDTQGPPLTAAADDERHRAPHWPRITLGRHERVARLVQGNRLAAPQRTNGARAAVEAIEALLQGRERDPEHAVLTLVPAGADPEVEAPAGEMVDRRRALGEERGMMKGQRRDERAESDGPRGRRQPRE